MKGKLVSAKDPRKAVLSWPNNTSPYPGQGTGNRIGDILEISTILSVAGVDLDEILQFDPDDNNVTFRDSGVSIVVLVKYELQVQLPCLKQHAVRSY